MRFIDRECGGDGCEVLFSGYEYEKSPRKFCSLTCCYDSRMTNKTEIYDHGRVCTICRIEKNWNEFYRKSDTSTGYYSCCKKCHSERGDNPVNSRRRRLKKIGWTPEMCDIVLEIQNGVCAVEGCEREATNSDHDHETGEARAMLCQPCNASLGLLLEDPELIRGLAEYAEKCLNARQWVFV